MGISSGYFAMINSSGSHPSTNPENICNYLKEIAKHRKIWQALNQLSQPEYRQLTALFDESYQDKYSIIIRDIFKDKTGLALCLFNDLPLLMKLAKRYPNKLSPLEHDMLTKLRQLTDITYDNLLNKVAQYL